MLLISPASSIFGLRKFQDEEFDQKFPFYCNLCKHELKSDLMIRESSIKNHVLIQISTGSRAFKVADLLSYQY